MILDRNLCVRRLLSTFLCLSAFSVTTFAQPVRDPPIPTAREALEDLPSFGWAFARVMVMLTAMLAAFFILLLLLRRRIPALRHDDPTRLIRVIEVRRLEPKRHLYLIELGGQYVLIGSSDGRLVTLAGDRLDQQKLSDAVRRKTARTANAQVDDVAEASFAGRLESARRESEASR